MTKCPPGLALGINRFNSPFAAMACAAARQTYRERQWIDALKAETPLTPR